VRKLRIELSTYAL